MNNPNQWENAQEHQEAVEYWESRARWAPETMPKNHQVAYPEIHRLVRNLIVQTLGGAAEDIAQYAEDKDDPVCASIVVANRGNRSAREVQPEIIKAIQGYAGITGYATFNDCGIWGSTFQVPGVHIEYCLS